MLIRGLICGVTLLLTGIGVLAQETRWNGFMDINNIYDTKTKTNSFNLGQLDFFIVSDVTDRISFLAETTFTPTSDGHDGHASKAVVERAIVKYEVNNYLNFLVGRHHSPVSYWNNTYHHGRVLQPTATRPFLFDYNLFPWHNVGLIVKGDFIGKNNFGYQFMIGNGTPEHHLFKDNDKYKSVSLTIHFHPLEDFKVMLSAYGNKIAKGTENYQKIELPDNVSQTLYSVCLAYLPSSVKNFEFLSEGMYAKNKSNSVAHSSYGAYAYVGYEIKKFTPYFRFDHVHSDKNDPFFKIDRTNATTLGLRYSFSHLANIKTEWAHIDSDVSGNKQQFQIQFGIGF